MLDSSGRAAAEKRTRRPGDFTYAVWDGDAHDPHKKIDQMMGELVAGVAEVRMEKRTVRIAPQGDRLADGCQREQEGLFGRVPAAAAALQRRGG